MANAKSKPREKRMGPFVLKDELPSGGPARTFRAIYAPEQRDPNMPLTAGDSAVVKVLRDSAARDEKVADAFSREAELLSLVSHENVVRWISRGVTAGRMWSALEYIEGEDLGTVIQVMRGEELRLRPELVVSIAADVLAGVAAAQAVTDPRGRPLGFIHRDLTPRHIMLGLDGRAKIIDCARALLSVTEEPSSSVSGTLGYLSPEQARRDQLTQSVDVYQVGLVMFELLTGTQAFSLDGITDEALVQAHANNKKRPWPRDLDLPLELVAVVDKALATTPEERPVDAAAMYAVVENLLSDPDEARRRLGVVARDLVRSDPDKPAPLYC